MAGLCLYKRRGPICPFLTDGERTVCTNVHTFENICLTSADKSLIFKINVHCQQVCGIYVKIIRMLKFSTKILNIHVAL